MLFNLHLSRWLDYSVLALIEIADGAHYSQPSTNGDRRTSHDLITLAPIAANVC